METEADRWGRSGWARWRSMPAAEQPPIGSPTSSSKSATPTSPSPPTSEVLQKTAMATLSDSSTYCSPRLDSASMAKPESALLVNLDQNDKKICVVWCFEEREGE